MSFRIHNFIGGHGLQTFREVLQNSSNPGFVEIGRRLGKDKLYNYVQTFGLTKKTGVDLTGESSGIMFSYDNFNEVEQATVAFGLLYHNKYPYPYQINFHLMHY